MIFMDKGGLIEQVLATPRIPRRIKVLADAQKETSMTITRHQTVTRMSQAVVHGDTVYLAGQVARDARGGSVTDQTRDILARIDALLAETGTSKGNLLTATVWLADMATFEEMNAVWDAWVAPGHAPARACVEASLATPEYTVEIMVIAARGA